MKSQTISFVALLGFLLFCSLGCVRRRLTVRTQPAGATVYVDKQYIGTSPTATPVTYYGTREIEVVKDGYRTEKVLRTFNPPWYQLPPLDFFTETLWPRKIRDERIVDIAMVPQQVMSSEQLQIRASTLRLQAAQGVATPLPPAVLQGEPIMGMDGSPLSSGGMAEPVYPPQPSLGAAPQPYPGMNAAGPTWRPGQYLRDFFLPGGSPPTRIPEAGILPGGGYRPEM